MKVAEETWEIPGDEASYWLNAAVKFADDFTGWGGFGAEVDTERMGYPEEQ